VLKEILDGGVDLEWSHNDTTRGHKGKTALAIASEYGHLHVVNELLNRGANIEAQDDEAGTALFLAAGNNHLDVVKELLNRGANVNARKYGSTPLYFAAVKNSLNVVKELLDKGAIISQGGDRLQALHGAVVKNNVDVIEELLDRGANVEAQDDVGRTALHVAAQHNNNPDIVKQLLDSGAKINAKTKNGLTALHYAAMYGNINIVPELVGRGANIFAADQYRRTPLDEARENYHEEIAQILLTAEEQQINSMKECNFFQRAICFVFQCNVCL